MANIYDNKYSIAFDIYGCPNHCQHCWIGQCPYNRMDPQQVFAEFEKIKEDQLKHSQFDANLEYLGVDFREPHFGNDYQELYPLADKMNGCSLEIDRKFDLISLWRINRDKEYARWLKERGFTHAQLKVFGLGNTNNYFYGRENAHSELINGTSILLDNGIIPRWQIYYNKMGIDELSGVIDLANDLRLFERSGQLGEEFNMHGMTFDSDGNGYDSQYLRIDKDDYKKIPRFILEISDRYFKKPATFKTEAEYFSELEHSEEFISLPESHWLWFFVTSDWNVYPNIMGIAPWWKLGNLMESRWEEILGNYVNDNCLGLKIFRDTKIKLLVNKYCDRNGSKMYSSRNDLLVYLINKYLRNIDQKHPNCA